jgi:serine/threonine protein kinase
MPPDLFTHIEGYEFRELLGQGGFGSVCKAIDRLGREVAIKVLALTGEEGAQQEASNRAFLKEARTLAQLNHPNIVTIYSFDIDSSGQPYLVMEFLPGEPLSRVIRSGRQLHLVEKLSIILQAAKALQFAHNAKPQPVIHRDIKPHNLMVMPDLTVKLIDFGIAQVGGIKSRSMNNVVGSLPYMSPEHWQLPLTPWGDVFSLGVVFFELLTGTVPFATEQDTVPAAYQKIASDTPAPPLKQFLPDVPAGLEEVMAKALSKKKTTGYEDAQQFWLDLSRVHNSIRSQFIAEGLERAIAAKNAGDYETASDLAQKLLSVDRENHDVGVLQSEINQAFHRKERSLKVRSICERVEEALVSRKFDLAQLGLDEALQLDPGSQTVALLNQRLRLARDLYAKIEALIAEAEKHKQSGHWNDASQLVAEALALDRSNTLALKLHSQIDEMKAIEHQLCVDARAALDQLRFQEAFQIIRQAESVTANSERVKALKEYAVTVHREQTVRQEVETAFLTAQRLYEKNDLPGAIRELRLAITKYPDQKKLLGLRDTVELKLAEAQRERSVQEQCVAAERECSAGNPSSALARLEEALLKFPGDARLLEAAEQARKLLAKQESQKRRAHYVDRVRESLRAGNASAAIVTLEMALEESASDRELQALMAQARAMVATQAADYGSAVKILTRAKADFPSDQQIAEALRLAQQAGSRQKAAQQKAERENQPKKAGLENQKEQNRQPAAPLQKLPVAEKMPVAEQRPAPAEQAAKIIECAQAAERTGNYAEAIRQWELAKQFYPQDPQLQERIAQLAALEAASKTPVPAPQPSSRDVSATLMMTASEARQTISERKARQADADTAPSTAGVSADAASAPAAAPSPEPLPVLKQGAAPWKKPLWLSIAAVGVIVLVWLVVRSISSSAPEVTARFQVEPQGSLVSINGKTCTTPCSLPLKPGKYKYEISHDGYDTASRDLSMGAEPQTITLTLSAARPVLGTLSVATNVDSVQVVIDGTPKGITEGRRVTIPLSPGSHQIAVKKQGYAAPPQTIEVTANRETPVQFTLNESKDSTPVADPYVYIKTLAGAKIQVDNKNQGEVPPDGSYSIQLKPGSVHTLSVTKTGYQAWFRPVKIKPGADVTITAELKETPKPLPSISFTANPSNIQQGTRVELSWKTQDATEVTLDGVPVGLNDTKSVTPNTSMIYKVTAKGPGGVAEKTIVVNVASAPKPLITRFEAGTDDALAKGQSTKLIWETQYATEVTIDHGVVVGKTSGSYTVKPETTTPYTLTAKGLGGTSTQTVIVRVADTPQPSPTPIVVSVPTPTPTPVIVRENPDVDAIKGVIERYKEGSQKMDIKEVEKIWKNIPRAERSDMEGVFNNKDIQAYNLREDCSQPPQISGDSATYTCRQTATYKSHGQTQPSHTQTVVFYLRKTNGRWYIEKTSDK